MKNRVIEEKVVSVGPYQLNTYSQYPKSKRGMNEHQPQLDATGCGGELGHARRVVRSLNSCNNARHVSVHQEGQRVRLPVDLTERRS